MELIGMAIYVVVACAIAAGPAILATAFKSSRRFALAIFLTPPISIILLYVCGWSILGSGYVCGPNPEWDRCTTPLARTFGLIVWITSSLLIAFGAFQLQKVLAAAIHLLTDTALISILADDPQSRNINEKPTRRRRFHR